MMTYDQRKAALAEKEHELELLKEAIARGRMIGNGAPQMLQDLITEIHRLKLGLYRTV